MNSTQVVGVVPWRVLAVEALDELRGVIREPVTLFFSVAMPVGFFALFVSLYGSGSAGGTSVGTTMLATFGTFGVVGVTLMTPGIGVAEDRGIGWLRAKAVTATPIGTSAAGSNRLAPRSPAPPHFVLPPVRLP